MAKQRRLLTPAEAKAWFNYRGISIADFARAHEFHPNMVTDLLAGRKRGVRGDTHRAAVLLRLKHGDPGPGPIGGPAPYNDPD